MTELARGANMNRMEKQGTVIAGADTGWIKLPIIHGRDALLTWHPGGGGTMTVTYTIDSEAAVDADTAESLTLISAAAADGGDAMPSSVTAIKFAAVTANGEYRIVV